MHFVDIRRKELSSFGYHQTNVFREQLSTVVYISGLCTWPKDYGSWPGFCLEKGKGWTHCQQLEDQLWAPWILLLAPSLLHSQQPYFPGFAFLHQRPD